MLFDIERTIKKMNDRENSDEYKRLVYDLESFIIDVTYANETQVDVKKQAHLGKLRLAEILQEEKEIESVLFLIRPVLLHLGINESVKGFRFIEYCVYEAAKALASGKNYHMKQIYPLVAERFSVTAHNCERLCRYACMGIVPSKSFSSKYPFFEELTRRTYEQVTVKELVDMLVKYVVAEKTFCQFN